MTQQQFIQGGNGLGLQLTPESDEKAVLAQKESAIKMLDQQLQNALQALDLRVANEAQMAKFRAEQQKMAYIAQLDIERQRQEMLNRTAAERERHEIQTQYAQHKSNLDNQALEMIHSIQVSRDQDFLKDAHLAKTAHAEDAKKKASEFKVQKVVAEAMHTHRMIAPTGVFEPRINEVPVHRLLEIHARTPTVLPIQPKIQIHHLLPPGGVGRSVTSSPKSVTQAASPAATTVQASPAEKPAEASAAKSGASPRSPAGGKKGAK